jgi:tetratricopeptide (TPR) repeat protein
MAERTKDIPEQAAQELPDAIRVLISAERLEPATALLPPESGVYSALSRHGLVTARALVAEATGELDDALILFENAAERWAEFGFLLEEGQALFGVGRCLLAMGRRAESSERLTSARQIFARLEARPLIDHVDAHVHRAEAL